ncbi:MAG TPA: M24 family metallopeptidase [Candidatus Dormibacteraeota bacterium]
MNDLFNASRATQVLNESGVDAVLATRPENWLYLTGMRDSVAATIGLPTVALLTRTPLVLRAIAIPRLIAGFATASIDEGCDVAVYGEFPISNEAASHHELDQATRDLLERADDAAATVADAVDLLLRRASLERARIAVDDPGIAQIVAERLPSCRIEPGRPLLERIRAVKTDPEIARLAAVVRIVEELEALAFQHIQAGKVWDDFVGRLPALTAERGATFGFFSGGAGWRSGFLFPPVEEPLARGDLVRLDITIERLGYWADTGRTACVGEPSELVSGRYAAIRGAVEAGLAAIRPGVRVAEIYDIAMGKATLGIAGYRRKHVGHSIGARPYDGFLVAPDDATQLEPNMVLNVEVPYYGVGWGGLQLEETVVVTADGCVPLTKMSRDLVAVPA